MELDSRIRTRKHMNGSQLWKQIREQGENIKSINYSSTLVETLGSGSKTEAIFSSSWMRTNAHTCRPTLNPSLLLTYPYTRWYSCRYTSNLTASLMHFIFLSGISDLCFVPNQSHTHLFSKHTFPFTLLTLTCPLMVFFHSLLSFLLAHRISNVIISANDPTDLTFSNLTRLVSEDLD